MAPGLVTDGDILEFDLSGEPVDGQGRPTYAERFIHSEIYRRRPEVKAIVHSHSPAVIPFGVTSVPLKPIFHMSGFLGTGVPVFEIREIAGDTDMLVRNPGLGAALALRLGNKPAALMRGHGSVAVGISLPQVVYRAIYLEVNARLQSEAMKLGSINFLTSEEAKLAAAGNDMHVQRMANRHERGITRADIGTTLKDPNIDFAKIAQGMGVYAEGPISDPKDLGPALRRAIEVVKRGEPALLDTVTEPR